MPMKTIFNQVHKKNCDLSTCHMTSHMIQSCFLPPTMSSTVPTTGRIHHHQRSMKYMYVNSVYKYYIYVYTVCICTSVAREITSLVVKSQGHRAYVCQSTNSTQFNGIRPLFPFSDPSNHPGSLDSLTFVMMTFGSKDSSDSLSAWHWYSVLAVRFLVVLFALLELFPTIWRLPDKLPVNEEDLQQPASSLM